tara:strand:- start:1028 stop:1441 length:414 start_codon:yes stop_codon:yes gene_type:complete
MAVVGVQTSAAIAGAASEAINAFGDTVAYKTYTDVSYDTLYDEDKTKTYVDTNFKGRITIDPSPDTLTEIGLAQDESNIIIFTTQQIIDTAGITLNTKDSLSYSGKVYNISQIRKGGQYASAFITLHISGIEVDRIT